MDASAVIATADALFVALAGSYRVHHRDHGPTVSRPGGVVLLELFDPRFGTSVASRDAIVRCLSHRGDRGDDGLPETPRGASSSRGSDEGASSASLSVAYYAVDVARVVRDLKAETEAAAAKAESADARAFGTSGAGTSMSLAALTIATGPRVDELRMAELSGGLSGALSAVLDGFLGSLEPVFVLCSLPTIQGRALSSGFWVSDVGRVTRVLAGSNELAAVVEGSNEAALAQAMDTASRTVVAAAENLAGTVSEVAPSPLRTTPTRRRGTSASKQQQGGGTPLVNNSSFNATMSTLQRTLSGSMKAPEPALDDVVTAQSVVSRFALPPLRSSLSRAAFRIQTAWRRRQALKRIGEFIDGVFHTHAEVAKIRAEEERLRQEAIALENRRQEAAFVIQRIFHGFQGRRAARARQAEIQEHQKLRQAYVRRKAKRSSLYGCEGVPAAFEPKVKLLWKLFNVAHHIRRSRSVQHHRRRSSLGATLGGGTLGAGMTTVAGATHGGTMGAGQLAGALNYVAVWGAMTSEEKAVVKRKMRQST